MLKIAVLDAEYESIREVGDIKKRAVSIRD